MEDLEQRVGEALADADVVAAYLFGSRARGSEHAASDWDIAVLAGRELGFLEEGGLANRLSAALGGAAVDLVVLDRAPLELRGRVVQEGRPIHVGDDPARVAFEVRTRSRYWEYLPTLRAHTRRYLRQVAEQGLPW